MRSGRSRRWPLHPPPAPGEALSSWLARLAAPYDLSVRELLDHNLGPASTPAATVEQDAVDWDPPPEILEALAERTGTETAELRLMTVAGWVPWLADTLDPDQAPDAFHIYTRQDSVLLRRGEAGTNTVGRWLPWLPVDREPRRAPPRVCPVCATDPARGVALTAGLLLMLSCPDHGCLLEPEGSVRIGLVLGEPTPARPAPEPVAAVDRLTWEGLTTGTVTLPARPVHLGVWLRLLRTLIDEVSISTSRLRAASAPPPRASWTKSGRPAAARRAAASRYGARTNNCAITSKTRCPPPPPPRSAWPRPERSPPVARSGRSWPLPSIGPSTTATLRSRPQPHATTSGGN
ncbi:TniQ family protein [Actinomadura alba]|uniref:TniQ family protein n=1 Tax=Actinomadura alba TaxID=406431 RepID=A0ABR7LR80_9ACTN|nr:TniQ family protein [Actinomadura alba]MBC6467261.1 TniQ family protein [Actinomadura alba]